MPGLLANLGKVTEVQPQCHTSLNGCIHHRRVAGVYAGSITEHPASSGLGTSESPALPHTSDHILTTHQVALHPVVQMAIFLLLAQVERIPSLPLYQPSD